MARVTDGFKPFKKGSEKEEVKIKEFYRSLRLPDKVIDRTINDPEIIKQQQLFFKMNNYESGVFKMPVFFIEFYAFGLKFKKPVYGFEGDYTKKQLVKLKKMLIKETEEKLIDLCYSK